MRKHFASEVFFDLYGSAEKAYTPQEPAQNKRNDDDQHRFAYFVEQKIHIESARNAVHHHKPFVEAVDDHSVHLRNFQLHIIHHQQSQHSQKKNASVANVIFVYVLSENHLISPKAYVKNILNHPRKYVNERQKKLRISTQFFAVCYIKTVLTSSPSSVFKVNRPFS